MERASSRRERLLAERTALELLLAIASSTHSAGRHDCAFGAERFSDCPHELCRTACMHARRHGLNPDERDSDVR